MKYRRSLCSAVLALCGTAVLTLGFAEFNSLDPDPYELPVVTDILDKHVLGQEGAIVSATTTDEHGTYEADLRTLGSPMVDGFYRASDQPLDWAETVDLGAFYNAGEHRATVSFESKLIIQLEPGEVAFASSSMTYAALVNQMIAHDLPCKCRCRCTPCTNENTYTPCGDAPTSGNCNSLNNQICEIGECESNLSECTLVYTNNSLAN